MVCISGKTEAENSSERVFVMKNADEKIYLLLGQNADRQLAGFDWQHLNAAISKRLDKAGEIKKVEGRFRHLSNVTKWIAAAAAIVIITGVILINKQSENRLESKGHATVKFIESKGTGSAAIGIASGQADVKIESREGEKTVAAVVKINDLNGESKKEGKRASWIIITRPQPFIAENKNDNEKNFICLF